MRHRSENFDWNAVLIDNHDGDAVPLTECKNGSGHDFQLHDDIGVVVTMTGNLENALSRWIRIADFVFCCFAWLTNFKVLDALASLEFGCQVVVQKEDFLRPDTGHNSRSNQILKQKYERLRGVPRMLLPGIAGSLSIGVGDEDTPVRCAGVANSDRRQAAPRMHHKFAVACSVAYAPDGGADWNPYRFSPRSVWTGSFNPTLNGSRSRENAVIIQSGSVADFYLQEWAKVFAVSEPLDWIAEWSSPEWRIGT